MASGTVSVESQGKIAIVTFDRPARRNALDQTMWDAFERAIEQLERSRPRAIVLTGSGERAFCAGMDVNPDNPHVLGIVDAVANADRGPVLRMMQRLRDVADRFFALPSPIVAAVNGLAYGGGAELATRCDLRVIDESAVVCFSEVRLGLMPDWGGAVALTRLIGPARAADLVLTARRVTAEEALQIGLANRIVEAGTAREVAIALAHDIAKNGPRAVRAALEVIRRVPDLTAEEALALELERAVALIATGECVPGIAAFGAKVDPEFPDA
jgi:enoyl-CoA hydratase/carnithine racemase